MTRPPNIPPPVPHTGPLREGELFERRYRVTRLLGRGGYAHVYLAHQIDLERDVAIKVLSREGRDLGHDDDLTARFMREARALSSLRDPHTLVLYDCGQTDSGLVYLISEFVRGRTLAQIIDDEGVIELSRLASILTQLCYSLREAHEVGILHRDIKTCNVMMFEHNGLRDQVKLLDFGIAGFIHQNAEQLTRPGTALGTLHYIAPEVILGTKLTTAVDLYGVGLLAYEALTARPAYMGEAYEVVRQKTQEELTLPPEVRVPPEVRALINRMLLREPSERIARAELVIDALRPYLNDSIAASGFFAAPSIPARPAAPPKIYDFGETATVPSLELEASGERAETRGFAIDRSQVDEGAVISAIERRQQKKKRERARRLFVFGLAALCLAALAALFVLPEPGASGAAPQLTIDSTPSGASLKINGKRAGKTPVTLKASSVTYPLELEFKARSHTVRKQMSGYEERFVVDLEAEECRRLAKLGAPCAAP